jgi:hypothetical protein
MSSDTLLAGWQARTPKEACDELERELNVRVRCFPKWIDDGRLSESDARDRLQRIWKALDLLKKSIDSLVQPSV